MTQNHSDDYLDELFSFAYKDVQHSKTPFKARTSTVVSRVKKSQTNLNIVSNKSHKKGSRAKTTARFPLLTITSQTLSQSPYLRGTIVDSVSIFKNTSQLLKSNSTQNIRVSGTEEIFKLGAHGELFLKWTSLRDNYLRQLMELASAYFEFERGSDRENSLRRNFQMILNALRKISFRVVKVYTDANDIDTTLDPNILAYMEKYLTEMVTSLDELSKHPFVSWAGLTLKLNPFAVSLDICGSSTKLDHSVSESSSELNGSNDDVIQSQKFSSVLYSLFAAHQSRDAALGGKVTSVNSEVDTTATDLQEEESEDCGCHLVDTKFAELVTQVRTRYWMRVWKRSLTLEVQCGEIRRTRLQTYKRMGFDGLQRNLWQSVRFRHMQLRFHRTLSMVVFHAWISYTEWCRKYNSIHAHSIRVLKGDIWRRWKWLAQNVFEVRSFRRRDRIRRLKLSFRCIRNNAVLNIYALKSRLKTCSSLSFVENYSRESLFMRWRRRVRFIAKLDCLEEKIELADLKDALIKWALSTWGPLITRSLGEQLGDVGASVASGVRYVASGTVALSTEGGSLLQSLGAQLYQVRSDVTKLRLRQALTTGFHSVVCTARKAIAAADSSVEAGAPARIEEKEAEESVATLVEESGEAKVIEKSAPLVDPIESRSRSRMLGALMYARSISVAIPQKAESVRAKPLQS